MFRLRKKDAATAGLDIRKQTRRLYLFSFASCLRLTDAVWVALLVGRGYSLWQVGLAEGIFHLVSLAAEIPSGMAADLLGRRRTLALYGVLGMASALCMAGSRSFFGVCLSMLCKALACSFVSGTQEAILYDSLVAANETREYLTVNARCTQLQSLAAALGNLASLLTDLLGFVGFYLAEALVALTHTAAALGLAEPLVTEQQARRQHAPFADLPARFRAHVAASVRFLAGNPAVARLILADAAAALPCYLLLMYLQQRLVELGLPAIWLGIPIMLVRLSGLAGMELGRRLRPERLSRLFCGCTAVCAAGLLCAGLCPALPAAAGAVAANMSIEAWTLHAQKALNEAYPSDQRATLVSVNSMAYSLLMIAASPLSGWAGDLAGTAGASLCALSIFAGLVCLAVLPRAARSARR